MRRSTTRRAIALIALLAPGCGGGDDAGDRPAEGELTPGDIDLGALDELTNAEGFEELIENAAEQAGEGEIDIELDGGAVAMSDGSGGAQMGADLETPEWVPEGSRSRTTCRSSSPAAKVTCAS